MPLACAPAPREAARPPRPSVVLVVLDTTRADFLSGYGFALPTTPEIDALAAQGARFTSAFSTSFWTLPAHASLFTGLYPGEAGATSETNHLPGDVVTLAERFAAAGYRTFASSSNSWISVERGFDQGFEELHEAWRQRPGAEAAALERSLEWLREVSATPEPFFLFLNLNTPHLPYDPPRELARRFVGAGWPGERLGRVSRISGPWAFLTGRLALDGDDFRMLRELYATEVHHADLQLGVLLAALGRTTRLDDTVVVVTSDHGENIGDHGRLGHTLSMFDTTLRVPLVVRYPPRFAAGEVIEELVSLVDVAPTLLDVAGLAAEGERTAVAERSLAGERRGGRRYVVAENDRPVNGVRLLRERFPEFDADSIDRPLRMLRTERYKLVWAVGAGVELFDLATDPGEESDAGDRLPEVREALWRGLREWSERTAARREAEMFESRDEEALEWLRSLGYIQ